MNAASHWHSQGLRWIAALITDLANFLDRLHSAPQRRASMHASDACDEARAQARYRGPYY